MAQKRIDIRQRLASLGVDAICSLLQGPRAQSAFLVRSSMDPPWAMEIRDEAPLTVMAVVRGKACMVIDPDDPQVLSAGDVALVRGPSHYLVADDPSTPVQVVIDPGQVCRPADGSDPAIGTDHPTRSWGNRLDGRDLMVTGTYESAGQVSGRLLRALPPLAVIRSREWETPLVALLAEEIVRDAPGQAAILDRLLDLLCLAAVRAWFTRTGAEAPPWYRASADPVIGPVLDLIHDEPSEPWTVATLAARSHLSRAAFARRFHDLVGEPPLTYLTRWRLDLAADHLMVDDATVGSVSRAVGYTSPFAFSHAFKRHTGSSPSAWRTAATS